MKEGKALIYYKPIIFVFIFLMHSLIVDSEKSLVQIFTIFPSRFAELSVE